MVKKKQRVLQHLMEDESYEIIKSQIPKHWVIREFNRPDYGIDLVIELFELVGIAKASFQVVAHGLSGAIMSDIDGGNGISGMLSGMISSAISSGIEAIGKISITETISLEEYNITTISPFNVKHKSLYDIILISSGGLSGGISSSVSGGKFWEGVRQGLITSSTNHLFHQAEKWITKKVELKQTNQKYSYDCVMACGQGAAEYFDTGKMKNEDSYKKYYEEHIEKLGGTPSTSISTVMGAFGIQTEQFTKVPSEFRIQAMTFIINSFDTGQLTLLGFNETITGQSGSGGHASLIKEFKYTSDYKKFQISLMNPMGGLGTSTMSDFSTKKVFGIFSLKKTIRK